MSTLEEYMKCPCKRLEAGQTADAIMEAYREARARGAKEGFIPVLMPADSERFTESLEWEDYTPLEKYRAEMLAKPVEGGKAWFAKTEEELRKWGEGVPPAPEDLGPMEGGEASDEFTGILDYNRPRKSIPLLLAEIPVTNPWEVFAWVPFGGWNECPLPEDHIAVAKYWYEKYGAVPAVITEDVLEFSVPAPVKREEAQALAWEQYLYCADIVVQGCESIGLLADILSKSTTWFFWWD